MIPKTTPGLVALCSYLVVIGLTVSCSDNYSLKTACVEPDVQEPVDRYLRDYQYGRYRFMDIGRIGDEMLLEPGDVIIRFELYQQINTNDVTRGKGGTAFEDVRTLDVYEKISPSRGRFEQLGTNGGEWLLYTNDPNRELPYIKFVTQQLSIESKTLAYYVEVNRDGTLIPFGNLSNQFDSLELQLLKTSNPSPEDPFWDAEWKNVYDLGIRNIDYNTLSLDIYKGQPGDEQNPANLNHQNSVPYLQILGLDRMTQSGTPGADGRIDHDPTVLDLESGLLIFPDQHPFDSDVGYSPNPAFSDSTLHDRVPKIYETLNYTELQKASTYYFQMRQRTRTSKVYVGHPFLLPETEIITFNGRRLIRGSDYWIDYEVGYVTLLRDEYLDPTGVLRICYDYCDSKL